MCIRYLYLCTSERSESRGCGGKARYGRPHRVLAWLHFCPHFYTETLPIISKYQSGLQQKRDRQLASAPCNKCLNFCSTTCCQKILLPRRADQVGFSNYSKVNKYPNLILLFSHISTKLLNI